MRQHSKLTPRENVRQEQEQQSTAEQAREFASVEDVLRHDAAQIEVPPELTRRVQEAAALRAPKRWWWRLFGH